MARRRRRRHFRGTPAEHAGSAAKLTKDSGRVLRQAEKWAKQGACYNAWKYLARASFVGGMAASNLWWTPSYYQQRKSGRGMRGAIYGRIERARKRIQHECPVPAARSY